MANVLLKNITKVFPASSSQSDAAQKETNQAEKIATPAVLDDINLTINDGEFMVLVGPSGCGKSTLLRLISGLETLTSGEIQVGDRIVNTLPPKQRDIAMVFQSYALYPHLSVYDNLAFGLRRALPAAQSEEDGTEEGTRENAEKNAEENAEENAKNKNSANTELRVPSSSWIDSTLVGLTRKLPAFLRYDSPAEKAIRQRVGTVAKMLQIEDLLNRLPKQLSGGQKQRVALGRAMARNPQVFLMDEPLSNLDAKLRTETRAQIVSLQRQLGTTTIYVTHDQTEAMTMGNRIAVMHKGHLQQVAPPLELYRTPANKFVAAFIGSPPMNFLTVTVRAGQLVHSAFNVALSELWKEAIKPYTNQTLTLGIRPEHITIGQTPNSFPAIVNQFEALGSETFVIATLSPTTPDEIDNTQLQIRIPAEYPVQAGNTFQISLPPDKIHLFDPHTEHAIRP
ncbi:MAG: ATP-binding cassette domain-containing protein [Cyanobacteria bacterium J06621_11]